MLRRRISHRYLRPETVASLRQSHLLGRPIRSAVPFARLSHSLGCPVRFECPIRRQPARVSFTNGIVRDKVHRLLDNHETASALIRCTETRSEWHVFLLHHSAICQDLPSLHTICTLRLQDESPHLPRTRCCRHDDGLRTSSERTS